MVFGIWWSGVLYWLFGWLVLLLGCNEDEVDVWYINVVDCVFCNWLGVCVYGFVEYFG